MFDNQINYHRLPCFINRVWKNTTLHSHITVYMTFGFFLWGITSHSIIFQSYGDVTITGKELQILTYARHSLPLSCEGSWACHTYCNMGHPFIMVISEHPWHSRLLPRIGSGAVTTWFYELHRKKSTYVKYRFHI